MIVCGALGGSVPPDGTDIGDVSGFGAAPAHSGGSAGFVFDAQYGVSGIVPDPLGGSVPPDGGEMRPRDINSRHTASMIVGSIGGAIWRSVREPVYLVNRMTAISVDTMAAPEATPAPSRISSLL